MKEQPYLSLEGQCRDRHCCHSLLSLPLGFPALPHEFQFVLLYPCFMPNFSSQVPAPMTSSPEPDKEATAGQTVEPTPTIALNILFFISFQLVLHLCLNPNRCSLERKPHFSLQLVHCSSTRLCIQL